MVTRPLRVSLIIIVNYVTHPRGSLSPTRQWILEAWHASSWNGTGPTNPSIPVLLWLILKLFFCFRRNYSSLLSSFLLFITLLISLRVYAWKAEDCLLLGSRTETNLAIQVWNWSWTNQDPLMSTRISSSTLFIHQNCHPQSQHIWEILVAITLRVQVGRSIGPSIKADGTLSAFLCFVFWIIHGYHCLSRPLKRFLSEDL